MSSNKKPRLPNVTAYFVFADEVRTTVRDELVAAAQEGVKVGVAQVGKQIGALWGKLTEEEKNKYKEIAAAKTTELRAKLVSYTSTHLCMHLRIRLRIHYEASYVELSPLSLFCLCIIIIIYKHVHMNNIGGGTSSRGSS